MKLQITKIALLTFLIAAIAGCTSKYQVRTVDDEFSDPNSPIMKVMDDNCIWMKDPLGLVPQSELNAYVFRDRKTNEIKEIGFYLSNVDHHANLRIREDDKLTFVADNERVVLYANNTKSDHMVGSYNTVTRSYPTYYFDSAYYSCSKEDFLKIANSQTLKFKVEGKNGSKVYGTNLKLLSSFIPNLKKFCETEL